MNQQLNSQQALAITGQQLQTIIGIVVGLAIIAIIISDAIKAIKGALRS